MEQRMLKMEEPGRRIRGGQKRRFKEDMHRVGMTEEDNRDRATHR